MLSVLRSSFILDAPAVVKTAEVTALARRYCYSFCSFSAGIKVVLHRDEQTKSSVFARRAVDDGDAMVVSGFGGNRVS